MLMVAPNHDADRPIHFMDAHGRPELSEYLSSLLPQANLISVQNAFSTTLLLLTDHLDDFTGGVYQLTATQKYILSRLKHLQEE